MRHVQLQATRGSTGRSMHKHKQSRRRAGQASWRQQASAGPCCACCSTSSGGCARIFCLAHQLVPMRGSIFLPVMYPVGPFQLLLPRLYPQSLCGRGRRVGGHACEAAPDGQRRRSSCSQGAVVLGPCQQEKRPVVPKDRQVLAGDGQLHVPAWQSCAPVPPLAPRLHRPASPL